MLRQCPHCNKEHSIGNYICEVCGTELLDNGQLIDALAFCGNKKPSVLARNLIPLGLVTASGIASAALGTHLILLVGIAAAAIYFFKSNKFQVHR